MIFLKKVKFKWSTLGRCSQDEIFSFAIIRILKEKTKWLQNDSGNKSNRRWSILSLVDRFQPQSIYYSAVYVLLSIIISLGGSLIFVALHKESSLHPPSKLLYRCLATTDLLVGIFSRSITATYSMSLVYEHWSLCQYTRDAAYIMWSVFVNDDGHKRGQASSPDVGAEIQTYCNFKAHISHCSHLLGFLKFRRVVVFFKLPHNLMAWPYRHITIFANLNHLVHKDFLYSPSSSGWRMWMLCSYLVLKQMTKRGNDTQTKLKVLRSKELALNQIDNLDILCNSPELLILSKVNAKHCLRIFVNSTAVTC